ncbi:TolB family protein [Actinoplanes subglobosus]|uniref:TolB family protein n=1 Tax=Actinoplanes subglobosus TaxID=1547892 RepID=A0ABV8J429_9ACTN
MINLPEHLADLADEVMAPVDMRDRVLASSRRATVRRRALLAGSAAAAVLVIASGVAWAGLPGPSRDTPVEVAAPSSPPAPLPSLVQTGPAVTLPERLFFLAADGRLQLLRDLDTVTTLFTPAGDTCGLTVTPEGTRIAWVVADGGGATGDLVVAEPDGGHRRTVITGVACTGGNSPVWMPGGRQLLIRQGNAGPRVLVDTVTGATSATAFRHVTGYLAWSPAGSRVAYRDGGDIVVARPDGSEERRVAHRDESPTGGFSVQGVTDDGLRVIVGMQNSDPDLIRSGFRLVDTGSGRDVELPAGAGGKQVQIRPAADGFLLLRAGGRARVIGPDADIHVEWTEPAILRTATLL